MSATPAGPGRCGPARRWTRPARTMDAYDVVRRRRGASADVAGGVWCEAATCRQFQQVLLGTAMASVFDEE